MKRAKTCLYCGKSLNTHSNYCHHCGKRARGEHEDMRPCSSCKRLVDGGSTYCRHCGTHLKRKTTPHSRRLAVPFIIILLFFIGLLFLLFTPRQTENLSSTTFPDETTLSLSQMSCTFTTNGYRVCGDVAWQGGAYAKAHIPGGEELTDAAKHFTPFTYCQTVGIEPGFRLVRAYAYNNRGEIAAERSEGIACAAPPLPSPPPSTYSYSKRVQFYTESFMRRAESTNSLAVQLPDPAVSCAVDGSFVIDDGGYSAGSTTLKTQQYCDGARGALHGIISAASQSVIVDADYFRWNGNIASDPEPTMHDGYAAFAYTCDPQYYTKRRYYTSVTATGIGTSLLTLDWYYKNDDTKPRVFFDLLMNCTLKGTSP